MFWENLTLQGLSESQPLSTRIASTVFWGLLLLGVVFVMVAFSVEKRHTTDTQSSVSDRFAAQVSEIIAQSPDTDFDQLIVIVQEKFVLLPAIVSTVILETQTGQTSELGQPLARMDCFENRLHLPANRTSINSGAVTMTLCMESVEARVNEKRMQVLLWMSTFLVIFGLLLHQLLKRIISKPFNQMLTIARSISDGNESCRFNEIEKNEFGYLGRFINLALDYSMEQRAKLNDALEHVYEAEMQLQDEKDKAIVTLRSIGDAVITTDAAGYIEFMNPMAQEITGWGFQEVQGLHVSDFLIIVEEETRKVLPSSAQICLETAEAIVCNQQKLIQKRNGEFLAISDSAAPIFDQSNILAGSVMVFRDVGHARQMAMKLSYQASHDPLTGLFNRREFEAQLGLLLQNAQTNEAEHALCYLDLDQFKVVNDVCGHNAGDELLKQLSELLSSQIREADILARLGGDEFGVLLTHCNSEQAMRIAENMRVAVHAYRYSNNGRIFDVGASIGVVSINETTVSAQELMSSADMACYAAKDAGRNRVHFYQPTDTEVAQRKGEMNWVTEVRMALDESRFHLLYQPIAATGALPVNKEHFEILLRMNKEDQCILPMAFLPAAERYNLMSEIDRWVISEVVNVLLTYESFADNSVLFINLSGQSLCDENFTDFLEQKLQLISGHTSSLCFEVSEQAVATNQSDIGHICKKIKQLGCKIALDNFGGGIASMGNLRELAMDYVKINGANVRNISDNLVDHAMVRSINEIAHVMGAKTIAEMVEDQEIFSVLTQMGVDYCQGYGVALPESIDVFLEKSQNKEKLSIVP